MDIKVIWDLLICFYSGPNCVYANEHFDLLFINIRNLHVLQCSTANSSFERQRRIDSEKDKEPEIPMPIHNGL